MGLAARPLAAFAVLPLLGTTVAKAPDLIKALRLLGSAGFVLCLLVDLMFSSAVAVALPPLAALLGLAEAAVSLALLGACEAQARSATRLAEALAVAQLLRCWGAALGTAMAHTVWGENGFFTSFTSEKCPKGSACMRMEI